IRYAEVLLTYAEAMIESNQIDERVLAAIIEVWARPDVNMPPIEIVSSQDDLRDIVRRERLVEFAFEGLRYYDIRRWKAAENDITGIIYGMTYVDQYGHLQTISRHRLLKLCHARCLFVWPL